MLNSSDSTDTPSHRTKTSRAVAKSRLSPSATQLLADRQDTLPIWVRSPKNGVEFYSGFSRAKLYDGAAKGFFRSVSIREPGQVKGTRLFHLQSILAFIESCEAAAEQQPKTSPVKAATTR